jgi:UDP-3-O-[3-hydroxymyristoyl] glucosamine N-acyltransferase
LIFDSFAMPREDFLTDLSNRGDLQYRDLYVRQTYAVSNVDTATASAYTTYGNVKTLTAETTTSVAAATGEGSWEVSVRDAATGTVAPRLSVAKALAVIDSEQTELNGTLKVANLALFEDDVDVTTGSVTIGENLVVEGNTFLGNALKLTKDSNTSELSEEGLTFTSNGTTWRIVYDPIVNGLAFEQLENGVFLRRFQFTHTP